MSITKQCLAEEQSSNLINPDHGRSGRFGWIFYLVPLVLLVGNILYFGTIWAKHAGGATGTRWLFRLDFRYWSFEAVYILWFIFTWLLIDAVTFRQRKRPLLDENGNGNTVRIGVFVLKLAVLGFFIVPLLNPMRVKLIREFFMKYYFVPMTEFFVSGSLSWKLALPPLTALAAILLLLRLNRAFQVPGRAVASPKKWISPKYLILGIAIFLVLLPVPMLGYRYEQSRLRSPNRTVNIPSKKHQDGGYLAERSVVGLFEEKEYRYTGGRYDNEVIKYRFRSPKTTVPGQNYPLVVWLHGRGESGDDNSRQLAHMQSTMEQLDGKNELDFFILATQCPKDNREWPNSVSSEGKGDASITILSEILDDVLKKYPVDRNRIGLIGVCSGGTGAWSLLKERSGFFSGAVVFSTSPPVDFPWDKQPALWAFTNLGDRAVSTPEMRRFVNRINRSGGMAHLTVRDASDHDSWSKAMKEDKAVAWLVKQDRVRRSPPPGVVLHVRRDATLPWLWFGTPLLGIAAVGTVRVRQCGRGNR